MKGAHTQPAGMQPDDLATVRDTLKGAGEGFEAIQSVLRWFEEAMEARSLDGKPSSLLVSDVGHLRLVLEAFTMSMADYTYSAQRVVEQAAARERRTDD